MTHDELLAKIDYEIEYNLNQGGVESGLGDALRAVVELHKPYLYPEDDRIYCIECNVIYPCITIQAIEKELVMTHDELLAKIDKWEYSDYQAIGTTPEWPYKALRAVVELPKNFTDKMNITIVNEQDPVTIAKVFYKAGYKNAMHKVIEAIEKELG